MVPGSISEISSTDWQRLEAKIAAFDAACHQGDAPRIDDFLDRDEPHHLVLLIELIHTDFEYRLKQGTTARVEDYLKKYPQLKESRSTILELIRAEWAFRKRRERQLSYSGFIERFPDFRDELEPDESDPLESSTRSVSAPAKLPEALPLPRMFGQYELRQKIGNGPWGVVYRAGDTLIGGEVALKIARPEVVAEHPDLPDMIRRAARARGLRHLHIVSVLDCESIEGQDCVASVYVEGTSLAEQLRLAPFAPEEAAALMILVAEAVDHAHQRRTLHGNLKPSNILLDPEGQPHLTDFGLWERDPGRSALSAGWLAYLSPEQTRGEVDAESFQSDVFSLGVILYELLTGTLPFRGRGRILLRQIRSLEPAPPGSLNDEVVPDLQKICHKALAKDPEDRYRTAEDFAADLRAFLSGRSIDPRPPRRRRRFPGFRGLQRNLVLVAAGLTSLLIAATVLWRLAESRQSRSAAVAERAYRSLLEVGRSFATDQAWLEAERLAPELPRDPAHLSLALEARSGLAEWASARGSDRRAEPHWLAVIELIDRLDPVDSSSPVFQERAANARFHLGSIRQRAGRAADSSRLFEQALLIRQNRLEARRRDWKRAPSDPESAVLLMEALIRLAESERGLGHRPDLSELESVLSARPVDPSVDSSTTLRVANVVLGLAGLELRDGMEFKSLRFATEAVRLFESVPVGLASRIGTARARLAQALASDAAEHLAEARNQLRLAINGFESLRLDGFDSVEIRRGLGQAWFELGCIIEKSATSPEATMAFQNALAIRRRLARDEPAGYLNCVELAEARWALAVGPDPSRRLAWLAVVDRVKVLGLAPGLEQNRRVLRRLLQHPLLRPRFLKTQNEPGSSSERGGAASIR